MSEISREALLTFAHKIIEASLEGCDVDGVFVQDHAETAGLLIPIEVTEPCGDPCSCEEWGDFPQTCYRFAPELQAITDAAAPNPHQETQQ